VVALAALPILAVLVALVLRSRGVFAAYVGWGIALILAFIWFPADSSSIRDATSVFGPLGIEISLIIIGGVGLALVMERTGRQDALARFMISASNGRDRAVLLVAICVTCIAESVTGFGVSIVVTVPLLLALSVRPSAILVISLVSLVIGPWGSLAPGTLVAAQVTGLDFSTLGMWSAVYNVAVLVVAFPIVAVLGIGRQAAKRHAGELIALGAAMTLVLIGANVVPGPPLAGALAGLAGALVLIAFGRRERMMSVSAAANEHSPFPFVAFLPYLALMGTILVGALIEKATGGLTGAILGSPVTGLVVGIAIALLGSTSSARTDMAAVIAKTSWQTVLTSLGFLGLGATMTASGMSSQLAEALAGLGPMFPMLVPLVGGVAGYVTSTTTAANALFASAIHASSGAAGIPQMALMSSFNVSAAYASVVSPSRIALAMSMLGQSRENVDGADPARATRTVIVVIAIVSVLIGAINGAMLLTETMAS
jgi:lactate permease